MATLQKQQTILYEVQQACIQLGIPSPNGVYDSTDDTALLMGGLGNLAGILLTDTFLWQDLQNQLTYTGNGVTTLFPLPDDFSSIVDSTGWSSALRRPVTVLGPQRWAAIKAWLSNSFYVTPACRIYQNNIQFLNAPAAGDLITFQYRICNWVIDADNPSLVKPVLAKNGDIPRFDWMMMVLALKVKWLEQKGMDTVAATQDLNTRYGQLTQNDEVAGILSLSGLSPGDFRYIDNFYNTPDTNLGM